jgi:CRP-like cAMP-binding protein
MPSFNLLALLRSAGLETSILRCDTGRVIFSAGDAADSVMYMLKGTVQLSVVSELGREAVIGRVRAGDFLGEASLAGQQTRATTATAMSQSALVVIDGMNMLRLLHAEPTLRDRFIERVLLKNLRAEADLIAELVSSCE